MEGQTDIKKEQALTHVFYDPLETLQQNEKYYVSGDSYLKKLYGKMLDSKDVYLYKDSVTPSDELGLNIGNERYSVSGPAALGRILDEQSRGPRAMSDFNKSETKEQQPINKKENTECERIYNRAVEELKEKHQFNLKNNEYLQKKYPELMKNHFAFFLCHNDREPANMLKIVHNKIIYGCNNSQHFTRVIDFIAGKCRQEQRNAGKQPKERQEGTKRNYNMH